MSVASSAGKVGQAAVRGEERPEIMHAGCRGDGGLLQNGSALLHRLKSAIAQLSTSRDRTIGRGAVHPLSESAGFRFPPEAIVQAIRWYLRFSLSCRDVEGLLAERGARLIT